ncbi:hypothetical protein GCAAIG_11925 [Candidatus Electronema halotolerans]
MKFICFQLQLILLAFFMVFLSGVGLSKTAFAEETGNQHNLFQSFALQDATSSVNAASSNASAPEFAAIATNVAAVSINADFFDASRTMRPGDTILMNLFDGEQAVLEIQAVETDVNHVTTLRGPVQGSAYDFFYISIDGDKLLLTFDNSSNKRKFEVVFNRQTGEHTLYEIPQERIKVPEDLPPIVPPANRGKLSTETSADTPDPNEEVTVDVMVVYTPAAKAWADSNGDGIDSVISQAMSRGQQALDNSSTMLHVRLVHSAEVSYTESGSSDTDLDRLQETSDGYMDDVHTWRTTYGADLVTLFALVEDTGGLGYALMSDYLPDGFPDYAFSLIRVQQAGWTYTVIHELGHNMGAGHHKEQNVQAGPQLYSYSAGWRWTGSDSDRYCSVMTYESGDYFDDGESHVRTPYFSNPNVSHLGAATGDAADGDNARTLRETKHLTANYRSSSLSKDEAFVAAGVSHTVFIQSDGSLWTWGWNEHGQLGDGTTTERHSPVRIGTDSDWKAAAAGGGVSSGMGHTVALKQDGSLWAWGDNASGQLGDGTTMERHSPVRIGTDSDWKDVTAAGGHTVALKEDGSLWAWGWNGNGQLGDGTATDRHSPVRIGTDNDWKDVAAGMYHTAALKNNGSIWTWGYNYYGQLGNGTTTPRSTPGQAGTDSDWRNIFHGGRLALKNEASLWSWGYNGYGQIGDGTTEHKYSPVQVGTDNNWLVADGGGGHVIALKTDGSLWSWGYNANGQLGDGTTEDKHIPMQMGASTDWQAIAAGNAYSMAMKQDGSLWAWGDNGHGQLGDGTMTNRHAPVQVVFLSGSDTDNDGIDDGWEMTFFHNLTTANATSDYDRDGYSDLQEYLNWLAHETDPNGTAYNPTEKNAPGGTGYVEPSSSSSALRAVLNLLL